MPEKNAMSKAFSKDYIYHDLRRTTNIQSLFKMDINCYINHTKSIDLVKSQMNPWNNVCETCNYHELKYLLR